MKDETEFGEFLKTERIKSGFKTQREFAIVTGVSHATISRLEAGHQRPAPETLQMLADHLADWTYNDLLFISGYLSEDPRSLALIDLMKWLRDKSFEDYKTMFSHVWVMSDEDIKEYVEEQQYEEKLSMIQEIEFIKESFIVKQRHENLEEALAANKKVYAHEPFSMLRLPVLGSIRAGVPTEHNEGYTVVDPDILRGRDAFALRVKDDSMIGDRIHEGDIAIVIKQEEVQPHEIAVVSVDDSEEATLKRVKQQGDMCMLIPSNPSMTPELVSCEKIRIIGKVVEVKFRPK